VSVVIPEVAQRLSGTQDFNDGACNPGSRLCALARSGRDDN
jgi:hypothetical protein